MKKKNILVVVLTIVFAIFIVSSLVINYVPGEKIYLNFKNYFFETIKILPFAFVLIGLFEVWVKRETVEKHLGHEAGFISYIWALILGGSTVGPMIVSLPIAHTLYNKGARPSIVFAYIGAASVCRIPMTIFEASYIGVKFTFIRYAVSIPLIIIFSKIMGTFLKEDLKERITDEK